MLHTKYGSELFADHIDDVRQRVEKLHQLKNNFSKRGTPGMDRVIENMIADLERELEQLEATLRTKTMSMSVSSKSKA